MLKVFESNSLTTSGITSNYHTKLRICGSTDNVSSKYCGLFDEFYMFNYALDPYDFTEFFPKVFRLYNAKTVSRLFVQFKGKENAVNLVDKTFNILEDSPSKGVKQEFLTSQITKEIMSSKRYRATISTSHDMVEQEYIQSDIANKNLSSNILAFKTKMKVTDHVSTELKFFERVIPNSHRQQGTEIKFAQVTCSTVELNDIISVYKIGFKKDTPSFANLRFLDLIVTKNITHNVACFITKEMCSSVAELVFKVNTLTKANTNERPIAFIAPVTKQLGTYGSKYISLVAANYMKTSAIDFKTITASNYMKTSATSFRTMIAANYMKTARQLFKVDNVANVHGTQNKSRFVNVPTQTAWIKSNYIEYPYNYNNPQVLNKFVARDNSTLPKDIINKKYTVSSITNLPKYHDSKYNIYQTTATNVDKLDPVRRIERYRKLTGLKKTPVYPPDNAKMYIVVMCKPYQGA